MDLTNGFGLEYPTNKLLWGSISDFKKRLMDRGWPHNFERKIAIRGKTHRKKQHSWKKKNNNKEEKEILSFVTQYKPLVSIIKEALMKIVISYKTNHYLANFLKRTATENVRCWCFILLKKFQKNLREGWVASISLPLVRPKVKVLSAKHCPSLRQRSKLCK